MADPDNRPNPGASGRTTQQQPSAQQSTKPGPDTKWKRPAPQQRPPPKGSIFTKPFPAKNAAGAQRASIGKRSTDTAAAPAAAVPGPAPKVKMANLLRKAASAAAAANGTSASSPAARPTPAAKPSLASVLKQAAKAAAAAEQPATEGAVDGAKPSDDPPPAESVSAAAPSKSAAGGKPSSVAAAASMFASGRKSSKLSFAGDTKAPTPDTTDGPAASPPESPAVRRFGNFRRLPKSASEEAAAAAEAAVDVSTVEPELALLQADPSTAPLDKLRASLASATWRAAFLQRAGLDALFAAFDKSQADTFPMGSAEQRAALGNQLMLCIEAAVNAEVVFYEDAEVVPAGLMQVVNSGPWMFTLVDQLHPAPVEHDCYERARVALDILRATVTAPNGHSALLAALKEVRHARMAKHRLAILIVILRGPAPADYKGRSLALINAIISGSEQLEERVRHRVKFVKLGLADDLPKLEKLKDEDVSLQIQDYYSAVQSDLAEVEGLAKQQHLDFDVDNIDEIFKRLKAACKQPTQLVPIMQHLLAIVNDTEQQASEALIVIDRVAAAISKSNDPPQSLFVSHAEVKEMRLSYDAQLEAASSRNAQLQEQIDALLQQLETAKAAAVSSVAAPNVQTAQPPANDEVASPPAPPPPPPPPASDSAPPPPPPPPPAPPSADFAPPPPPPPAPSNGVAPPPPPPPMSDGGPPPPPPPPPPGAGPPPPPPPPGGPPPPPPPPGAGPPPPPPPPGGPPPPPPPGGLPPPLPPGGPRSAAAVGGVAGLPIKPVIKPKLKLKRFNWTKLPNSKIPGTVWIECKDVSLDEDQFESTFVAKETAPAGGSGAKKAADPKAKTSLLDMKRANQVGIAVSRIRVDFKLLRKAIIELDDAVLSIDQIQSLLTLLPTPSECQLVREYQGDRAQLDKPEQFFLELEIVPNLTSRVEFWVFSKTLHERLASIVPALKSLSEALDECLKSTKLVRLLEIVLMFGNHLNGGTHNGRAYGFKIDALLKLADTKASDNRSSLLHYLASFVDSRHPELLDWWTEMPHVQAAAAVSFTSTKEEVTHLKAHLKKTHDCLDVLVETDVSAEDAPYVAKLTAFLLDADVRVAELDQLDGIGQVLWHGSSFVVFRVVSMNPPPNRSFRSAI
eukprot:TRINITY_DN419_c0_g2_i2.p1 TRINITY_DN419_c0_g2~~TRINITY_DN419_c0_g2_i2.p1  ORF type:complete len:1136 (-),score=432.75 TRINITY_DN419_c0_g2_i2:123-3530(-)